MPEPAGLDPTAESTGTPGNRTHTKGNVRALNL